MVEFIKVVFVVVFIRDEFVEVGFVVAFIIDGFREAVLAAIIMSKFIEIIPVISSIKGLTIRGLTIKVITFKAEHFVMTEFITKLK